MIKIFLGLVNFSVTFWGLINDTLDKDMTEDGLVCVSLTHRTDIGSAVFSLALAPSPMASRSYRRASDFLNYLPGLASDFLAERKSEKKRKNYLFFFLKNVSPSSHDTVACQKLI